MKITVEETIENKTEEDEKLIYVETITRPKKSKWTDEEINKLLDCIRTHGKNRKKIVSSFKGTRTEKELSIKIASLKLLCESDPNAFATSNFAKLS